MNKTPSAAALDLLKAFEQGPKGGFAAMPYLCPAGKQTIGWGHVLKAGDNIRPPITAEQADDLLRADLARFAQGVDAHTKTVPLTPSMFDALVSFAFNVGLTNFSDSTLLAKLKRNDYVGAASEFLRWNKARDPNTDKLKVFAGLTRRRTAERTLFLRDGFPTT